MKFLKFLIFVVFVAGAYFGFLRDKYIEYPINVSLANTDGKILSVRLLGRSERFVQFKKYGNDTVFDYRVDELSIVSKVKLVFLPNVRYTDPGGRSSVRGTSETSELHLQGMEKELAEYYIQVKLLISKHQSKVNPVKKAHVQHEIEILDEKIKKLKYKMDVHKARSL